MVLHRVGLHLAIVLLFIGGARAEQSQVGEFVEGCRNALKLVDGANLGRAAAFGAGQCIGFVQGIGLVGPGLPGSYKFCLAQADLSLEDAIRVIIAHAEAQPAPNLQELGRAILKALSVRYRCPDDHTSPLG